MPDKAVSTNQHIVLLGKPDELVCGREVVCKRIGPRVRIDGSELHLIFSFEFAKLGRQGGWGLGRIGR